MGDPVKKADALRKAVDLLPEDMETTCLLARTLAEARQSHTVTQRGAASGFEMCFAVGSQHLWYWGGG